jgi:glycosyltransferase involved in cell wall biosynthesis
VPALRKLFSVGHSYVLAVNRRLAAEMAQAGRGRWEVVAVAPREFAATGDIRRQRFEPMHSERVRRDLRPFDADVPINGHVPLSTRVVPTRLTNLVHVFSYDGTRLRDILRGADFVHAWEEPYILAGWQIAQCTPRDVPLVFRSAQSLNKRYPQPFAWMERSNVARMAGWICSGRQVEANLLSRPGYEQRPHRLIPLGVDLSVNRPDRAAGAEVLRDLGWIDDGTPVIGFLGRFVREKGLHVLMRTLDAIPSEVGWRAMFVGNGALEPVLRRWAEKKNRSAAPGCGVRLCTDVSHDEVPAYLNAMSMLVAPSQTTRRWREQFGRMIIEAFACGVPVIGSDSGEIPALVGETGLIVPERDSAAWTRTILDLLHSPARRRELAERGLARAPRFAWSRIAEEHLEFFDQLLSTRQPPASPAP